MARAAMYQIVDASLYFRIIESPQSPCLTQCYQHRAHFGGPAKFSFHNCAADDHTSLTSQHPPKHYGAML
jgi:hypothetical protein